MVKGKNSSSLGSNQIQMTDMTEIRKVSTLDRKQSNVLSFEVAKKSNPSIKLSVK